MLTVDGNCVVGASSAEGALTVVERWRADLVLVAEGLSGMGGLELADRLRNRFPDVPVILMAEQRSDVQVSELETGIIATLTKPFRFEALRTLIESLQLSPAAAE